MLGEAIRRQAGGSLLFWIIAILLGLAGLFSAGHALLNKRDPRAALGWILFCLLVPGGGAAAYWIMGVNRIRSRARTWQQSGEGMMWMRPRVCQWSKELSAHLPFLRENYASLLHLADSVSRRPLVPGNRVTPLYNGEQAYPAMLEAIASARRTLYLSTYIFDTGPVGQQFVKALREAGERGVDVRVLIDGVGERYSLPVARRLLRKTPVRVARFLPPSLSGRGVYFNLRNHRKLLVSDATVGFAGGMNIGARHLAGDLANPRRVQDIHFRFEGSVVGHFQEAFIEDWGFATGEQIPLPDLPEPVHGGQAFCRGICAGPNEDLEKLAWLVNGALASARHTVRIMTPYLIPNRALISSLNAAALRGVEVQILLPEQNNLPYVAWATSAYLWELLQYGTRIYYQPPPFAHSKLLLVDDAYALVGSANLDPRSLRLNFEFNVEVYDRDFTATLARHFDGVLAVSRETYLAEVDGRPLPVKLRDGVAKLFSPYL